MTLLYLSEESDRHGNTRMYFRKRGRPRIRLRAEIGTTAFMTEYQEALQKAARPRTVTIGRIVPGSLRWLAGEYFASGDFKRLDEATQGMRRRQIEAILPKWGKGLVAELTPKYVRLIRDEKSETPHAADNLLKTLRVMFKWAIRAEHMKANPAREVEKINQATDGHHTWTVDEIAAFLKRHPVHTKAGLALSLLLYFGVRRGDVVKLSPRMESGDGWLRMRETKGRNKTVKIRDLPILPVLEDVLRLHRKKDFSTYLVTQHGKPFTHGGFGNWFRDRCDEAALYHCSAHGLRKAGATMAADNGATEHQLMALYGWTSPSQASVYTRRANRKKLAGEAAGLVGDQKPNECVAPKIEVA